MEMRISLEQMNMLEQIRNKYQLQLILLHGSRVTEKTHPKSDIDIAVVRKNNQQKLDPLGLYSDLGDAFASNVIDIADITHADPLFLFSVIRHSQLLSGSQQNLDSLSSKSFHLYNDFLPYLKQEQTMVQEKLSHYVTH